MGHAFRIAELCCERKRPVAKLNSVAWPVEAESPLRVAAADLLCDVDRLRPRHAVVGAASQHELTGFVRAQSWSGAIPSPVPLRPQARDQDVAGPSIH